ncbi:MAG: hypothetical protein RBS88_10755 [Spongiibacteraceae bacterium]|nr:hypothetical protein [Spongiibacteraceae bacterium]
MRRVITLLFGIALSYAPVTVVAAGQFSGVSTKGNLSVWRINHGNGAVSLCSFEGHKEEPICYPWSAGGDAGSYEIIGGDDVLSTWRINASTGAVSQCEYFEVTEPPLCTPWSAN